MEWSEVKTNGKEKQKTVSDVWGGVMWSGVGWSGVEWDGWSGVGWGGVGWSGMELEGWSPSRGIRICHTYK